MRSPQASGMSEIDRVYFDSFTDRFAFSAFGVSISIETDSHPFILELRSFMTAALAGHAEHLPAGNPTRFHYSIRPAPDGTFDYFQDKIFIRKIPSKELLLRELSSSVRIRIAEFAEGRLFVHAGVVRINGRGIMFPGNSQTGKSTLVRELISKGAEYYSDEYAVFDEFGLCYPFARPLSIRTSTALLQVPPQELNADVGRVRIPINIVIFTEFKEGTDWIPEVISVGNGIIETIPHAISMTSNADFALKVLKLALTRAIMLKGMRCDAKQFAPVLFKLIEDLKIVTS